jgi:hypothetical protein
MNGFKECWGPLADPRPHIFDLFKLGALKADGVRVADTLIAQGTTGIDAVKPEMLVKKDGSPTADSKRQIVQLRHSKANTTWVGEGMRAELDSWQWPLHFIDFETSALAIPYHQGMRPYEMVGFQWSHHKVTELGNAPVHSEWLNDRDTWPCLEFVKSLREAVGDTGTVLMWSHHERTTLRKIKEQMARYKIDEAELNKWIDGLTGDSGSAPRLVDMNRLCLEQYFHPDMLGRTSIKPVLDALWKADPEMRARYSEWTDRPANPDLGLYEGLEPIIVNGTDLNVAEGIGAMRAYQAMMYGQEKDDPAIGETLRSLLLRYCELDTLAMVLIWDHWRREVGGT